MVLTCFYGIFMLLACAAEPLLSENFTKGMKMHIYIPFPPHCASHRLRHISSRICVEASMLISASKGFSSRKHVTSEYNKVGLRLSQRSKRWTVSLASGILMTNVSNRCCISKATLLPTAGGRKEWLGWLMPRSRRMQSQKGHA